MRGATEGFAEEWDLERLWTAARPDLPDLARPRGRSRRRPAAAANIDRDDLIERLKADAHEAYDRREAEIGEEVMRELERRVLLSVLDRKWREHLYEMDYLREGIYLRAYCQRDPLVEYQREGFDMFAAMMDGIKEETVGFLFNLEVQVEEDESTEDDESRRRSLEPMRQPVPVGRRPPRGAAHPGQGPRPAEAAAAPVLLRALGDRRGRGPRRHRHERRRPVRRRGPQRLCPCGSGKKFKKCHGAPGGPTGLTARVS